MDHVRQLMFKHRPGASIRQLEHDHGLSPNLIGYYLKPGSRTRQMRIPPLDTLHKIADAFGCAPEILFIAFALDLGYPVTEYDRKTYLAASATRTASSASRSRA